MKKSKISLIMKIIAVVASLYGMLQSLDRWMFLRILRIYPISL
ncbi:MAG: hypothetical protein ACLR43_14790 [Faecalibacillus faecis]